MTKNKLKSKVYIDGANVFYSQKKLGWSLDWQKVKDFIEDKKEVVEYRYYTGIKNDDDKMRKYLRYLNHIKFYTITKPLKKIKISESKFIYKCNFDVEITTDILLEKYSLDEMILFSGDSDFSYLIDKLKSMGKKVIVFSSKKTLSWELKLKASEIVYLEDIREKIERR